MTRYLVVLSLVVSFGCGMLLVGCGKKEDEEAQQTITKIKKLIGEGKVKEAEKLLKDLEKKKTELSPKLKKELKGLRTSLDAALKKAKEVLKKGEKTVDKILSDD